MVIQNHRYSIYQDIATGQHWWGMAMYSNNTTSGLGLWASSEANTLDQGSGTGAPAHFFLKHGGNCGIGNIIPAYKLDVTGDIRATGDLLCQDLMGGCTTNAQYATATARLNMVAGPKPWPVHEASGHALSTLFLPSSS